MTRSLLPGAVIGLLLLAFPGIAWSCKCAQVSGAPPEGSPEAIAAGLAGYDFIFVGKVRGMPPRVLLYLQAAQYWWKTRGDRELSEEEEDEMFLRRIELEVETPFKGVTGRRARVYTGWGGGDCGYEFRRGERYLVYGMGSGEMRFTGICYETKPLAEAGGEVRILKSLVEGQAP